MYQRVILTLAITSLLGSLTACSSRTAAATQQTVTAFDATASDPQALSAVDEMQAAVGTASWGQVKQVTWTVKHLVAGTLTEHFKHSWDLWNGRHRFEFLPPEELNLKPTPDHPEPVWVFAMYDLFKRNNGWVANSKTPHLAADKDQAARVVNTAYTIWLRDAYWLSMFHKLRDPGVILKYAGERIDFFGTCLEGCIDVKVTFAPEVGTDEYRVLINKTTKLPEVIEKATQGGNMAVQVLDWVDVNGMKFPTGLKNLGADEIFEFSDIKIGEPDEALYVPEVRG